MQNTYQSRLNSDSILKTLLVAAALIVIAYGLIKPPAWLLGFVAKPVSVSIDAQSSVDAATMEIESIPAAVDGKSKYAAGTPRQLAPSGSMPDCKSDGLRVWVHDNGNGTLRYYCAP